jgi:hypothetical protein
VQLCWLVLYGIVPCVSSLQAQVIWTKPGIYRLENGNQKIEEKMQKKEQRRLKRHSETKIPIYESALAAGGDRYEDTEFTASRRSPCRIAAVVSNSILL